MHMRDVKHVNKHVVDDDGEGKEESHAHPSLRFLDPKCFLFLLFFGGRALLIGPDDVITELIDEFID